MTQTEPFDAPYSSVRVHLADGRELSGADGLQVWMARRYEREQREGSK